MAKKNKTGSAIVLSLVALVLGVVIGAGSNFGVTTATYDESKNEANNDKKEQTANANIGTVYDDFQIHFLELGNKYAGDAIYIKAGDTDILIDAGSRNETSKTISKYIDQYCTDGKLEYVVATHAHQDHIAGMVGTKVNGEYDGILYKYQIGTLIDGLSESNTTLYKNYKAARDVAISKGTKHIPAADCWNEKNGGQKVYTIDAEKNITMSILYNPFYFDTTAKGNENEYSVVTLFTCGDNNFLLTGDLEEKGEKAMANYYDGSTPEKTLPHVETFKAGHHGSYTASNTVLLDKIQPQTCVVTCAAGSSEYTSITKNQFPSQNFIDRISQYTDKVYVTTACPDYKSGEFYSLNGTIIVSSNTKDYGMSFSNNSTLLKDTDWFKANREMPTNWTK